MSGPSADPDAVLVTRAQALVADLYAPRPALYWIDLLGSVTLGWGAFAVGLLDRSVPACVVAVLALYRALYFVHEMAHQPRALPGFAVAWNVLVGVPLLVPSYLYVAVHAGHHRVTTHATDRDPEYQPFARLPRARIVGFLLQPLVAPLAFAVRGLVLAPLAWMSPRVRAVVHARASALAINPAYRRPAPSAEEARAIGLHEGGTLFGFVGFAALGIATFGWAFLAGWYAVAAGVAAVNQLRTLGAHRYDTPGEALSLLDQVRDATVVSGGPWTELWAPLGARYHALHHLFPRLPYHALPEAWRRLREAGETRGLMTQVTTPSLWSVVTRIWIRRR